MDKNLKVKRRREGQLSYDDIVKMNILSLSEAATPEEICKANEVDLKMFIVWKENFLAGGNDRLRDKLSPREKLQQTKINQQADYIKALEREVCQRQGTKIGIQSNN